MSRRVATTLVLAMLQACDHGGGGAKLDGLYRVDRVATDVMGCDQDVDQPIDPPFLVFRTATSAGRTFYAYDGCPDDTGVGCRELGGAIGGFDEPIDGGWLGTASSAAGVDGDCLLGYTEKTALLDDEIVTGLTIERHAYVQEHVTDAPCTTDEAARRAAALPCVAHDLAHATKL
ncbi:MAG: hypothetical protein NT062_29895 [Proteobacteria bacterium]|nr:hypothetical protein [Pseudomonadota bacterium]